MDLGRQLTMTSVEAGTARLDGFRTTIFAAPMRSPGQARFWRRPGPRCGLPDPKLRYERRMLRLAIPLSFVAVSACLAQHAVSNPWPGLGQTRQLCIGDEAECSRQISTKLKAGTNLDLVVTFEYGTAALTELARSNLDQFAAALKRSGLSGAAFAVEGHTDAKGPDEYNLELSKRRADAVIRYLKEQGLTEARFTGKGYGKSKPISSDPFASRNRRVETRLVTE